MIYTDGVHLVSSTPGAAGLSELHAFAITIGLHRRRFHRRHRHYDLTRLTVRLAMLAGATGTTSRRLIEIEHQRLKEETQ